MEVSKSGEFVVSSPKRARISVLKNIKGKYKHIRTFECLKCRAGFSGTEYFYVISNIDSENSTLDFYKLSDINRALPIASSDIDNVHEVGELNGFLFVKSDSGVQQFVGKDKKGFCSSSYFREDMEIIGINKKFTLFALKDNKFSILVGCEEKLADLVKGTKSTIFGEDTFSVITKFGFLYVYRYSGEMLCRWDDKRLVHVVNGEFNENDDLILYGKFYGYLLKNTDFKYSIRDFKYEDHMQDNEIYKELYAGPSNQFGRIILAHRYGYVFEFEALKTLPKERSFTVCQ